MDKVGLLYYTDNRQGLELISDTVCSYLDNICTHMPMPLMSVSHKPMRFGYNIVVPFESSILSMLKQILIGLIALETEYVFCVEHDVLYHRSHFDFTPPKDDIFYFNKNVWSVNTDTGECLHYDGMKKTSCMVANRRLLISHYVRTVRTVEEMGWSNSIGFEPGKMLGNYKYYESETPNIDIKHGQNIVRWRGKLEQYRCRARIKDSWQLTDSIPGWGKPQEFLGDIFGAFTA